MDYAVNTYDLYRDIQQRTGGEIYIGVLGPVRTGKSTFIKRFMDEMVLPYMEDENALTISSVSYSTKFVIFPAVSYL